MWNLKARQRIFLHAVTFKSTGLCVLCMDLALLHDFCNTGHWKFGKQWFTMHIVTILTHFTLQYKKVKFINIMSDLIKSDQWIYFPKFNFCLKAQKFYHGNK